MTIEEKAYQHYPIEKQKSNNIEEANYNEAAFDGYILGAEDWRKIDYWYARKAFCNICEIRETCKKERTDPIELGMVYPVNCVKFTAFCKELNKLWNRET